MLLQAFKEVAMKLTEEQCKRILAKRVGDLLGYEVSKPLKKINWEIVEMCEHVLEILFPENRLSDAEIAERIQAIKEGRKFVRKK